MESQVGASRDKECLLCLSTKGQKAVESARARPLRADPMRQVCTQHAALLTREQQGKQVLPA